MPKENKYPIPEGFEPIHQTEHHIRNIGEGFYRRDEEGNLIMAFWIKKENCNSADVAHGGMLMSIADYSLASASHFEIKIRILRQTCRRENSKYWIFFF